MLTQATAATLPESFFPSLFTYFCDFFFQLVVLTQPNIDLMWVADRAVTLWLPAGGGSLQDGNQINYSFHRVDMWIRFIAAVVSKDHALTLCPRAIAHAWPIVYTRLNALFPSIDPRSVEFSFFSFIFYFSHFLFLIQFATVSLSLFLFSSFLLLSLFWSLLLILLFLFLCFLLFFIMTYTVNSLGAFHIKWHHSSAWLLAESIKWHRNN